MQPQTLRDYPRQSAPQQVPARHPQHVGSRDCLRCELHELSHTFSSDAASLLAETGVRLVARCRKNMSHTIETVNSQPEKMGVEHLHACTNVGFELKVQATLIALTCTNLD